MPLTGPLHAHLGEDEIEAAEPLHRREIPAEQLRKFEGYVAEMFAAFGMDVNAPATKDTPRRYVRALFDITGCATWKRVFRARREFRGRSPGSAPSRMLASWLPLRRPTLGLASRTMTYGLASESPARRRTSPARIISVPANPTEQKRVMSSCEARPLACPVRTALNSTMRARSVPARKKGSR